ncbi:MAG: rfbD [candidate division NC10 bacterium]|nr:rfbD [candidate division NC10 bacterium]
MRVLVTGAKGQLGVELLDVLGRDHDVVGLDLPELDITKPEATRVLAEARPAWVVHAAAWTDVDGCERDPERALLVNGEGTRRVAEACRAVGAGLVYLSTDYVFDGRKGAPYLEADPVSPLSAYARSKVAGEDAVRANAPRWAITRTAWLFGVSGKNFVKTIVEKAAAGGPLRVVDDQVGSPTYARDLAEAIAELVSRELSGIYHLTNAGSCSWCAFTRAILEEAGLAHVAVAPMTTAELGRPAPRPALSVLANHAWVAAGMRPLRPWREALSAMLAEWKKTDAFPSICR